MFVAPIPRPIQFLIKDYADDRQVEALFFPEIFVTGSVFKSAMEERVLDPQKPQDFYQQVYQRVKAELDKERKPEISETLRNLIKEEGFHTQCGSIVVTLVDEDYRDPINRDTLKVWREGVPEPLSTYHSYAIQKAAILPDLSGIIVICATQVFYQTLYGQNQTQICVPKEGGYSRYRIKMSDQFLSFTVESTCAETFSYSMTLFQFPLKGPFNEPKRVKLEKMRSQHFDAETNRVFYQDATDHSLKMLDVTTMKTKNLQVCQAEDHSQLSHNTCLYEIQGSIIVMTDGSQITIYNFETEEVLRQFKPKDLLPSQKLRIVKFKDSSINVVTQASPESLAFSQLTFAES